MKDSNDTKSLSFSKIRHRRLIAIFVSFMGLSSILLFQIVHAKISINSIDTKIHVQDKRLVKIKNSNSKYKLNLKQMRNKNYLEQLARDRYFYSKQGETIYVLPDSKGS